MSKEPGEAIARGNQGATDRFEAQVLRLRQERKLTRKYNRQHAWREFKDDWVSFVCFLPRFFALVLTGAFFLGLGLLHFLAIVWVVRWALDWVMG